MKIVNDWGQLWRMSDRNYRRYLKSGINVIPRGLLPSPERFGGKLIGVIAFHAIDSRPSDYQFALDMLEPEKEIP